MYSNLNSSNVAFDIDGVVVDFVKSFIEIAEYRYGVSGFTADQIVTYLIENHIKLNKYEIMEIVNFILENPFNSNLKFISGAKEVLEKIMTNHLVTFISSRHVSDPIKEWFKINFTSFNFQIFIVSDPVKKLELLKKLDLKYFFDDRLETCELLKDSGLCPILYAQPWNRMNTRIPVVFNWKEIEILLGEN